jgi:hypothetical protein
MKVTFTRTAERRYRVFVEGPGVVPSWIEPAPGYDDRLPHHMVHFVVENELGIRGGVFGQLAAGGHARSFFRTAQPRERKVVKRGDRLAAANRDDTAFSERVAWLAAWSRYRACETTLTPPVSTKGPTRCTGAAAACFVTSLVRRRLREFAPPGQF